jgi:hypothetical protein
MLRVKFGIAVLSKRELDAIRRCGKIVVELKRVPKRGPSFSGDVAKWLRQGSAKPPSRVRIPPSPLFNFFALDRK